jgi:uncharacterized glyoxalase superfamily protein PhnB
MSTTAKQTRATIIPALRYRDATAALDFLTRVFGFEESNVFRDDEGNVQHAELSFGNGMIMIGPDADTPFGKFMRMPIDAGGVTASFYAIVDDPDAHHDRARSAGFEVVMPLRDESYGGREYSVRDPEGHVWTFGTYDPWAAAG